MLIPNRLIDAVKNKQDIVLFAGAGMSEKPLGFTSQSLRDCVGSKIQSDFPTYDFSERTLEDACDEYAALYGKDNLLDLLASYIPQNKAPLQSHVVSVKTFRHIVTTNWDLLFEAAYSQIGQKCQLLACEEDSSNFSWEQPALLKIHGTAESPPTMIATSDDYENYPDTHSQLLSHVSELLHNKVVLFAGYGLRDEHIRRTIAQVRRQRADWGLQAYAVGFYDEVRTHLLKQRQIEVLPYDAEKFLPELAECAGIT